MRVQVPPQVPFANYNKESHMTWTVIFKNNKGFRTMVFNGPAGREEAMKHLIDTGVGGYIGNNILCLVRGNHEVLFNKDYNL